MTIRFDTTDAQRMKFNTPFQITIYNMYSLHFYFFQGNFLYINIYLLGKKISTSQSSQQIVDMKA